MKIETKFNIGDKVIHGNFKGKVTVISIGVDVLRTGIAYIVKNVDTEETKDFFEFDLKPYKEPILNDKEREYLKNVIKPFRDRVESIEKIKDGFVLREYISISLSDDDAVNLPYFNVNTTYKGMKVDKKYTLEELGL